MLKEINNFESFTLSDTCKNNSQYFAFHKAHSTIIYDLKDTAVASGPKNHHNPSAINNNEYFTGINGYIDFF